jgi:cytochrome c biogenesis protein CcmG/thiol:disulfide interchange protein DsbE
MSIRNSKLRPCRAAAIRFVVVLAGLQVVSCGGREPQSRGPQGGSPSADLPGVSDRLPAPDFTLKDLDGRDVRLTDFRGQVVMVNFWATWCPPCRAEIPDFIELQSQLGPKGLQIIGISLDDEGAAKVAPFASQNRINYTMLVNGNGAANAYGGIGGIPTTFLLDRQGRVVERRAGVAPREHWQHAIASLLKEG